MYQTPKDCPQEELARLLDDGAPVLNAETILGNKPTPDMLREIAVTHETTAQWLFRRFRLGSITLSKPDAFRIAGEIERLRSERNEALDTIQRLVKEIAALSVKS